MGLPANGLLGAVGVLLLPPPCVAIGLAAVLMTERGVVGVALDDGVAEGCVAVKLF